VRGAVALVIAVLLGLPLAFFFAFNAVFSDGPLGQRLAAFGLTAGAFFVAAGFLAFFAGARRAWLATCLAAPAIVILALYTLRETQNWALHLLDAACVAGGSAAGVWVGRRLRRKKTMSPDRA
jgi:hypothetical protein